MTVSAYHYDPQPPGGYVSPFRVAYYYDDNTMTVLDDDHPLVQIILDNGGTIGTYVQPTAPSVSEVDQTALNAALSAEGSVVRALALVLLQEINTIRGKLSPALPAYTQAQLVTALKAKMRGSN